MSGPKFEQIQLTEDEIASIQGMPPSVAAGFVAAKRKSAKWEKLQQEIRDLQSDLFKEPQ